MLSKARASFIISLQKKKYRDETGLYVIEGDKLVKDYILAGMPVEAIFGVEEWMNSVKSEIPDSIREVVTVSYTELKKISTLSTPHNALALVKTNFNEPEFSSITSGYCIALETIQDPGNLGTIIRSAAWFGIPYIICSTDSVDCYNPKVIQSTMGGLITVSVIYSDLSCFLKKAVEEGIPVYGTYPDGAPIYNNIPGQRGILLFGNESKGISLHLGEHVTERVSIPRGTGKSGIIDSLNVAMSVSVILSEFTRKTSAL